MKALVFHDPGRHSWQDAAMTEILRFAARCRPRGRGDDLWY